ncbi:MAG: tetratricopeptide repeat protein [Blastocatellia bacterium]|nr:tetratricopeptide repeat protein [Blastocatellia bacterium]
MKYLASLAVTILLATAGQAQSISGTGTFESLPKEVSDALREVQEHPGSAEAYLKLGRSYRRPGYTHRYFREAEEAFNQAIRIKPDYVDAYIGLGDLYFSRFFNGQGQSGDAILAYQQAINIDPKCTQGYIGLGLTFMLATDFIDAVDTFKRATDISPDSAQAYMLLANAYNNLRQFEDALRSYRQVLRIYPDYRPLFASLYHFVEESGLYEEVIGFYNEAIRLSPKSISIYASLARIHEEKNNYQAAVEVLYCARGKMKIFPERNA